jgi:DeoR/GlpR family transcriptional regulator of sugar metabolism
VVCRLEAIDTLVTDAGVRPEEVAMLERHGIEVIVAEDARAI